MKYREKDIEFIRQFDFKSVAEYYGVDFDRAGKALCPFHSEKTPSFGVYKRHFGHCFGCGWSGDVINFVGDMFGLDFLKSIEKISRDFDLHIEPEPSLIKPTLSAAEAERQWALILAAYNSKLAISDACKGGE